MASFGFDLRGGITLQEHLGLFDTPVRRSQVLSSLTVGGFLFAAFLIILPARNIQLAEHASFVPVVDAVVLMGELIIATMLFAQATVFRSRALATLASGFVFIALLLVIQAVVFPSTFAPNDLYLSETSGIAWLMIFRQLGFPVAVILYGLMISHELDREPGARLHSGRHSVWAAGALVLAIAATALAIGSAELLPAFFINPVAPLRLSQAMFNLTNVLLIITAMFIVFMKKCSVLDTWLQVALAGWLIQSLLSLTAQDRFTLGWYSFFVVILITDLIVLIALIGESNRLYARLALSAAARWREREARLLSVGAVAATFSHEVGQPLAAITTSATAGLNWLTSRPPNVDKAVEALQASMDAGTRATDIIKSLRALFVKGAGTIAEFNINELMCETTKLLERELTAARIAVRFELDDGVPVVQADRVQLQQVFVNLLMNAVQSLCRTRGRVRRLTIRSAWVDRRTVLMAVTDNGVGIAAADTERVFDAFYTTKRRGTGLGLALCRSIIEDHGGSLWVARGKRHGAAFCLRLPCGGLPQ